MDILVTLCAIAGIILVAVGILGGPFSIGDERGTYTAGTYLTVLLEGGIVIILAGRCLGWW